MPAGRALLSAEMPSERVWLTSTVDCFVKSRSDARSDAAVGQALVDAITTQMPAARLDTRELRHLRFGLDLHLDDPSDQDQRLDALFALDAAVLSAGVDARLLLLSDWILAPARDALPGSSSAWYVARTKAERRVAWETRYTALATLRAPILTLLLSDPRRHGETAPTELAAVHGGLAPREAWLVRRVIRDTPKTRRGAAFVNFDSAPYEDAEIVTSANFLETEGWVRLIPGTVYRNTLSIARGPRAVKLAAEDLLVD